MVNVRNKGLRGEYAARDALRKHTGLEWDRTPNSGADSTLKGDLYIKEEPQKVIIEVKNYLESPISEKVLTNRTNNLVSWWIKLKHQASSRKCKPLLMFKYNRSKWFVCTLEKPSNTDYIYFSNIDCYLCSFEEWVSKEWDSFFPKK